MQRQDAFLEARAIDFGQGRRATTHDHGMVRTERAGDHREQARGPGPRRRGGPQDDRARRVPHHRNGQTAAAAVGDAVGGDEQCRCELRFGAEQGAARAERHQQARTASPVHAERHGVRRAEVARDPAGERPDCRVVAGQGAMVDDQAHAGGRDVGLFQGASRCH